ncbi:TIR domain-containing protein [Candidatus Poriferisodalis sp.]|uniref:TIR domain-containing protein n=1 Tax=Candidatus Poriferisodalis sp. TaxID=3101277 RepID=UPI003B01E975
MTRTRLFVSFDYDHDVDLKNLLVGQARNSDSPFEIADWSIKSASPSWRQDARRRIRSSNVVAVICGEHTHTASGVATELSIAQDERAPYFLLWGRPHAICRKPANATTQDQIYSWSWENLKILVGGGR